MTPTDSETSVARTEDAPRRFRRPAYDVQTADEHYTIRAVMPGVAKEDLSVALEGKALTIEGKRKRIAHDDWKPLLQELNRDDYRLQLQLNVDVADNITAKVENGILTLTLPKAEESKPRLIPVQ